LPLGGLVAAAVATMSVSISSAFDAGNIEVATPPTATDVKLNIKPDPHTELEKKQHSQWFHFRATPSAPGVVNYEISNAHAVSYPKAWPGTQVCASTDRNEWVRLESTHFEEGALRWSYEHARPGQAVYFAYFDPYDYERHLHFVARCAAVRGATVRSLGQTLDGRELDCVEVGHGPLHCWAVHRQHPGESQASWYAEGLLTRLLGLSGATGSAADGLALRSLRMFTFHIVPNMNPDGSVRGYLRTNAAGANLNREWASTGDYVAPTLERSPEVFHVLREMVKTGVDAFVDVHGDETLPVAFVAGAEGCACWGPRIKALQSAFVAAYARANPDMQTQFGYEADAPLKANLALGSNQVADRFDCLAVTLEMPFKGDVPGNLAHAAGATFQGPRAAALGASLLDALVHVGPSLRGVREPSFGPEDAYVSPVEDMAAVDAFIAEQREALEKEKVAYAVRNSAAHGKELA
jgi:murein tripeptide amidase MpaA